MAYTIMPSLPIAMAKGIQKRPVFNSIVQKATANRGNSGISLTPYAVWAFEFDLDHVQGNEASAASVIAVFVGTFMACNGQANLFLFTDPQDSTVSLANSAMLNVTAGAATPMGTAGDGTSTQFQLARSIGGVAFDVIQNLNGSAVIKVNGSTKTAGSDYSVSATGVVTFVVAPANAAVLTWSGSFYFLCRFDSDTVDAMRTFTTNNGTDLWDVSAIKFASEFV